MSQRNNIIKLPGLVDVHVHFREPGSTQKEDFYTGTQAAIAGGYTQVLDMPNNNPPTTTEKELQEKENLAKGRIWCDLGFNFGAATSSTKYFNKIIRKVFGLKLYMSHTTGPLIVDKQKDLKLIFESWPGPLPIMIHAQDELVQTAIDLAKETQKAIHICHVTANQLKAIEKARNKNVQITCEVTPHHLFLNKNDVKRLKSHAIMKPPLLTKKEQENLWANIDKIDMISTDHAPHTQEEKMVDPAPFGVPGLETTLPLMFTAVAKGKITTARIIEMTATNPRRIFNLPEQKDTFVLVDFSQTYKITGDSLFTKSKWTPFEGMHARGEINKVVLRGKAVFANGEFASKPQGKVIHPVNLPS